MTGHELVPEPDIKHGTRANQAYREKFLDRLGTAYAENVISKGERDARAALAHREGVTTDELRRVTVDLPEPAAKPPWPSAKARVLLYITAGAIGVITAIGGPVAAMTAGTAHSSNTGLAIMGVALCFLGIAALVAAIFCSVTDKVVVEEYNP